MQKVKKSRLSLSIHFISPSSPSSSFHVTYFMAAFNLLVLPVLNLKCVSLKEHGNYTLTTVYELFSISTGLPLLFQTKLGRRGNVVLRLVHAARLSNDEKIVLPYPLFLLSFIVN